MATQFGYVLQTLGGGGGGSGTASRPYSAASAKPFLGFGLLSPFRRDQKSDFAAAGAERLVRSCIGQVLGMEGTSGEEHIGELPWRPELGSVLYRLRHRNNDETLQHLARVYVVDALQRWEPRVLVKDVSIEKKSARPNGELDTLAISLRCDLISANVAGNQVVIPNIVVTVEV